MPRAIQIAPPEQRTIATDIAIGALRYFLLKFMLWMTDFFRSQLERTLEILGIAVPDYM